MSLRTIREAPAFVDPDVAGEGPRIQQDRAVLGGSERSCPRAIGHLMLSAANFGEAASNGTRSSSKERIETAKDDGAPAE